MKALLAQLAPVAGDVSANLRTVARIVEERPEADLAVFPELFLSGYDPPAAAALSLSEDDAVFAVIADSARASATAVMVGFAERVAEGVANSVVCFGPDGEWAACYRKTHLFGAEEREAFVAGTHLVVAEVGELSIGPLICFDVEFPEPARALCAAGAEVLVTVAANMAPYGPDHELAARARALDNRRPHIYVNRVGEQHGHRFTGGSLAIDAGGVVRGALGDRPELACIEIDEHSETPSDVDYLAQLRPGLPVRSRARASIQGGTR